MAEQQDSHLHDAAILTRAVENVFRKLIRFLVGRISLVKLQEMIRVIFVEESENLLRAESPHKNVSLTKLALMSGLDTRTLTKIRNKGSIGKSLYDENSFLKELTPGTALLDVWSSEDPYFDRAHGKPKILTIIGEKESFESLFSETVRSRGVTSKSLLHRLVQSGCVEVDQQSSTVTLVKCSYLPSVMRDQLGAVEMGFSAIGNLVDTVVHNLQSGGNPDDRFYQRGVWTYKLPRNMKLSLRREIRSLLEKSELAAQEMLKAREAPNSHFDQLTAGVGFFYFED